MKILLWAFILLFLVEAVSNITLRGNLNTLASSVDSLRYSVSRLLERVEPMAPGELYAAWYSGTPPVLHEIKTKRETGESTTDWIARHNAAVAAAQMLFPPI